MNNVILKYFIKPNGLNKYIYEYPIISNILKLHFQFYYEKGT